MTRDHTDAVMLPLRGVFVIVAHTLLPLQQGSYILYLSFPKIISARIRGAVRPKWDARQWRPIESARGTTLHCNIEDRATLARQFHLVLGTHAPIQAY
jgi:hypothetical protein